MCNKRLANTSLFFKLKASGIGRKNLLDHNNFLFSQILRLKTTTTFLDLWQDDFFIILQQGYRAIYFCAPRIYLQFGKNYHFRSPSGSLHTSNFDKHCCNKKIKRDFDNLTIFSHRFLWLTKVNLKITIIFLAFTFQEITLASRALKHASNLIWRTTWASFSQNRLKTMIFLEKIIKRLELISLRGKFSF
jgi:hypothetical protein